MDKWMDNSCRWPPLAGGPCDTRRGSDRANASPRSSFAAPNLLLILDETALG